MRRLFAYASISLWLALIGCLSARPANAEYAEQDSALFLSRICGSDNPFADGFCQGYVRASILAYLQLRPDDKFCGFDPKAYPGGAFGAMMKEYFAAHSFDHQASAMEIFIRAMHEKFPCQ